MGNRIALFSTSEPFDQTSLQFAPNRALLSSSPDVLPANDVGIDPGRLSRRPKNEDLCQGEMPVHAALIESLLAVPNALWYCSRGFLR